MKEKITENLGQALISDYNLEIVVQASWSTKAVQLTTKDGCNTYSKTTNINDTQHTAVIPMINIFAVYQQTN